MKKTTDIRATVLAGLGARKSGAEAASSPIRREPAYVASFGRGLNEGLKDQIARLESERSSGFVVLKLDPKRIGASAFANRDARSLAGSDPELESLKVDIQTRGQLEPVRVRPAGAGAVGGEAPREEAEAGRREEGRDPHRAINPTPGPGVKRHRRPLSLRLRSR